MKHFSILCVLLLVAAVAPVAAFARDVSPYVSTEWLAQNLSNPKLVLVDARKVEDYKEGHIPGAVSSFMGSWIVERNKLILELPENDDLLELIGSLGIKPDSTVVVVSMADNDYSRADAARVAVTMIVSGLKNVAILDGGYAKWVKEKKPTSTDAVSPKATEYKSKVDRNIMVSKAYVLSKIGKAVIVDNRDAIAYFGMVSEPWAPRPGHIKNAVNLPTPWFYDKDGLLRSREELAAMTANVVGKDKSKEVIVYCGVGGYAAPSWLLLTQMLGYRNVKFYDGSAQEWTADPNTPMGRFSWK